MHGKRPGTLRLAPVLKASFSSELALPGYIVYTADGQLGGWCGCSAAGCTYRVLRQPKNLRSWLHWDERGSPYQQRWSTTAMLCSCPTFQLCRSCRRVLTSLCAYSYAENTVSVLFNYLMTAVCSWPAFVHVLKQHCTKWVRHGQAEYACGARQGVHVFSNQLRHFQPLPNLAYSGRQR